MVISDLDGRERDSSFSYGTLGMVTHNEPHYETLYWKLPSRFLGNKVRLKFFFKISMSFHIFYFFLISLSVT